MVSLCRQKTTKVAWAGERTRDLLDFVYLLIPSRYGLATAAPQLTVILGTIICKIVVSIFDFPKLTDAAQSEESYISIFFTGKIHM
jgi:hypothetical protein